MKDNSLSPSGCVRKNGNQWAQVIFRFANRLLDARARRRDPTLVAAGAEIKRSHAVKLLAQNACDFIIRSLAEKGPA